MDRFNLLPSVNWNISHMLVVSEDGTTCAYGSRGDIIIVKNFQKDDLKEYETKFIPKAHKNFRVMGLSFVKVELEDEIVESLVSCGDDGRIKIWNIETGTMTHKCLYKKNANTSMKLVDIDVFPQNNCIVTASETGSVLKWNVDANKAWIYNVDPKIIINCVAVCPHVEDLIALGAQFGLVLIYSLKGEGKLRHRIRCHDNAVFSLSWCPVSYNALQLSKLQEDANFDEEEWKKKDKTLLLASCSKDRSIYICKAGTNGYCEAVLTLPSKPITNASRQGTIPNIDRGRYLKWIYPSVLLTFSDFNEMITVYMFSKNEQKSDPKQKIKLSSVKFEVKPLHNVHKRNISNFAVHLNNPEEVDFRVWSCSSDRLLVRGGYRVNYKEKTVTLPLLSGYIFCLDISPLNPDLLAIGTGDGKICVWNLSTDSYVDIATLSKKIDNKVMSIRWHPLYEGVLAFGTYEGRVGIFDLSQGRTLPTLFKLFHNKPIYKLCWTIPTACDNTAQSNEMHLFAVGNGDILHFNPSSPNEMPVSLNAELLAGIEEACKCKHKSDLCYNSDHKLAAIGLSNGDVCICSADSFKLLHTIVEQPKAIMSLAWHPKIVYECPAETSPCANWLATAGENVLVYSIDPENINNSKKIASLEVHTSRVLCVSWSPHINGRLLTCSADNTAIIWDVLNQTIIGRYSDHCAQVLCGVWSPVNKDVVITGSADFTCRMWSVSKDTINKIIDSKKKKDKIIEPTILNAVSLNDSTIIETPSVSFAKNSKIQTLFPSVNQDFHHSALLDKIFTDAINKLNAGNANDSQSLKKCDERPANDQSINCNGIENENKNEVKIESNSATTSQKNEPEKKNLNYNYSKVFGTDDELLNLVIQEEKTLESTGNTSECLILSQARFDLSNKIKEAINKNQVTEQLLALAPSVSPKLWKEACQVYIEQMIKTDNIFQAVNYQLALAKDDEAIELLCEKNRFKEAFVLARLRTKEETVTNVLEKWISYCYNCGLYRLGAHCHMYLKNEENACTFLYKSKLLKDMLLAIRLLKFYQPKRASDFAIECFKKHLSQLTPADAEILFEEFPEIKFLQPWYSSFKYFKERTANTADVTKWVLGMLAEDSLPVPTTDVNYDKLRVSIVDNTFNMNYEQLMTYVSALAALYISGISNEENKASALRNYIRGLSHCYNYKIINGNKKQSDSAYPMMRLLTLLFPKGLFQDFNSNLETDESTKMLCKSIKAYYCDFLLTWLVQCNDLPKSLKTLLDQNEEIGDGDKDVETQALISSLEPYTDNFAVIRDEKTKLQKVVDLLTLYIDDVLDSRTVAYFRESFLLKKLENSALKTSSPKTRRSVEIMKCSRPSIGAGEPKKPIKSVDELEIEESNLSISGLSLDQSNTSEVFEDDVNNDKKTKSDINEMTKTSGKMNENDLAEMKVLKDLMEEFEKQRISAPNPFYFHCIAKEYLENSKEVDDQLNTKLRELITRSASKCCINQD